LFNKFSVIGFVGCKQNLHESIDSASLHGIFGKFGNILSCKVEFEDGESKRYGFVHFETEEAAKAAIENVNGKLIKGKEM
jgi:polyadenylate-binding protein